jgi:hypothetical protein
MAIDEAQSAIVPAMCTVPTPVVCRLSTHFAEWRLNTGTSIMAEHLIEVFLPV